MNSLQDIYLAEFARRKGKKNSKVRKDKGEKRKPHNALTGAGIGALVGGTVGAGAGTGLMLTPKIKQKYLAAVSKGAEKGGLAYRVLNKPTTARGKARLLVGVAGAGGALLGAGSGGLLGRAENAKESRAWAGLAQRSISTAHQASREIRGWNKILGFIG